VFALRSAVATLLAAVTRVARASASRSDDRRTKIAIILRVFPVFVMVIYIFFLAPLILLFAIAPRWYLAVSWVAFRVAIVLAVIGSLGVCKSIWPKGPRDSGTPVS